MHSSLDQLTRSVAILKTVLNGLVNLYWVVNFETLMMFLNGLPKIRG